MRKIVLAITQMACAPDAETNIARAEQLVRGAAAQGANVVLIQELFASQYFCQEESYAHFHLAEPVETSQAVRRMQALARELGVVLPVSFFEKSNQMHFNAVVMVDADGTILGKYRKSHIPDDPGYYEKFYFAPGNTGFRVWDTRFGRIGVGICWDQWFPEAARAMALAGAELILYPTAIGTDPVPADAPLPEPRLLPEWQRVMVGHAVANTVPIAASNRIGTERFGGTKIDFFGASFVCDERGEMLVEMGPDEAGVRVCEIDLDAAFGDRPLKYRDRRPDLYQSLLTLEGMEVK